MSLADLPRLAIDALIDALIDREGGYVNHPADCGGPTRRGITDAVARAQGYTGPMRDLPRAEAATICRRICWLRPAFDRIAARAAHCGRTVRYRRHMGTAIATGVLKRARNALNRTARDYPDIMVDRAIGPRTLSALDGFPKARGKGGETVLLRAMQALQGERYIALAERRPSQEAFLYGWLANRIGGG